MSITKAAQSVLEERERQKTEEGWTEANDDYYELDQLALAAACYATPPERRRFSRGVATPNHWPWSIRWWKPGDRRRELVKAGALILAEIERLDRKAARDRQNHQHKADNPDMSADKERKET